MSSYAVGEENEMVIGIPREILENEHRVAALPETVAEYSRMGFRVLIETTAGMVTKFRPFGLRNDGRLAAGGPGR